MTRLSLGRQSLLPPDVAGTGVARPQEARARFARALHWLSPVWVLLPFVAAGVYVNLFNPTDDLADPGGPCLWHLLTGINGPTCGGTRMFYYLIHGNLVQAARHHLPALLVVPVLAYWWLTWLLGRFGVRLPTLRISRWVWLGYGVFFLVFSVVLRNIDWGPLAWFDISAVGTRLA